VICGMYVMSLCMVCVCVMCVWVFCHCVYVFKLESRLRWYNTWWSPLLRAFTVKWNAHMNWLCEIRESGGAPGPELRTTALDKVRWQGTTWTNTIKKGKREKKRRMCIAYTHTVCGEKCNLHCVKRRFSAPVVAKAQSAVVWLL